MDREPFCKYFEYVDGVYPRLVWKVDKMEAEMTSEEFFKMVAMTSFSWQEMYRRIVKRVEKAGIEWYKLPQDDYEEIKPNW